MNEWNETKRNEMRRNETIMERVTRLESRESGRLVLAKAAGAVVSEDDGQRLLQVLLVTVSVARHVVAHLRQDAGGLRLPAV